MNASRASRSISFFKEVTDSAKHLRLMEVRRSNDQNAMTQLSLVGGYGSSFIAVTGYDTTQRGNEMLNYKSPQLFIFIMNEEKVFISLVERRTNN